MKALLKEILENNVNIDFMFALYKNKIISYDNLEKLIKDIVSLLVAQINKEENKEVLKLKNIYLSGQEKSSDQLVIVIDKKEGFHKKVIENFTRNVLNFIKESKEHLEFESLKQDLEENIDKVLQYSIVENSVKNKPQIKTKTLKL